MSTTNIETPNEPVEKNESTTTESSDEEEQEDISYNYEDDTCNCDLCYYSREICEYIEEERKRNDDDDDEMMNEYIERRKMKEEDLAQKKETPI